jgi:hypothetical protein
MMMPPANIPVLRFSTDELPERDRVAATREIHGRLTARLEIEPVPGVPVHYRVIARALPGLMVSSGSRSSMTVRRTREMLADGNDDVALMMSSTAGHMVSQFGRELVIAAGEAILFSAADLGSAKTVSVPHCLNIVLRRRALASIVAGLEDRFMRPIANDNQALQLLTRYVRLLENQQSPATPELCHLVVRWGNGPDPAILVN